MRELLIAIGIFILLVTVFILCTTGCTTRPVIVTTDEHIIEASRSADILRASNEFVGELHRFIAADVGRIRELALAGQGGIREALFILDEYDALFAAVIGRIAKLERIIGSGATAESQVFEDGDNWKHPFLD